MENRFCLGFDYDDRGHGALILFDCNIPILKYKARTGSINRALELVNAIRPDAWHIIQPSEYTEEPPMVITPGRGRKVRLWLKLGNSGRYERTGYLIHPDGGKPGSEGCIVTIKDDAVELFKQIDEALKIQKIIPVYVNHIKGPKNGQGD